MSSAGKPWQQEHLCIRFQRHKQGISVDLAINGNRYVFSQLSSKSGIVRTQSGDDFVDGCRLHFQLRGTVGEIAKTTPQDDSNHQFAPLAFSIACNTTGGAMGTSSIRRPIAERTAFPIVASGGTIAVSPTPRTP